MSYYLPSHILRTLYQTILYPHLCYGICSWGAFSKDQLKKLQNIQTRCIRNFTDDNVLVENRFKVNNIFNLEDIYQYFTSIQFYKYFISDKNDYFINKINSDQVHHYHHTQFKSVNNMNLPFPRISKYKSSFYYKSVQLWNSLPVDIREIKSLNKFKRDVKSFILDSA